LDYGANGPIGRQSLFVEVTPVIFQEGLAPSRTFLLQEEADELLRQGYGARTTPQDVLIFGPDGVVDNTLRYADECVRHKVLDLVGDLSLLGCDLEGCVVAYRSGHQLNAALVRELLKTHAIDQADGSLAAARTPDRPDLRLLGAA
jgi:UDP-3-O-acyl-N-acetylglucosamine deacetylase